MNKNEIKNLVKELIEKTTIPVNEISVEGDDSLLLDSNKNKTTWFSVEVDQPHFFLDRGGEALFAINYLVRKMIENKIFKNRETVENSENTAPFKGLGILVDINGFQKKRVESIHAIAHMMAERARYFKSNIEVDPMPAFDRRIVHEFLSDAVDLKTESEGEGYSRRVVIKYVGDI